MPIPRRAIEVGSGTAAGLTVTTLETELELPEKEKPVKVNPGAALGVVKVITKLPGEVVLTTGVKVASSVFGPDSMTDPPGMPVIVSPEIGSTVGA